MCYFAPMQLETSPEFAARLEAFSSIESVELGHSSRTVMFKSVRTGWF
jgi:hypothetical protein